MNQLQKFGDASVSSRAVPLAAWPVRQSPWSATAKRIFDVTLALALLVVIAPLLLVIAVLVSLDGGPILYRHSRVGRGITPFDCLKFRTMIVDADHCLTEYLGHHPKASDEWARDQKLMFDPRITPIGKVLRRTSFDELPQIFNVLRGEMSLVGPRPVTSAELARYKEHVGAYASVLPGITGLWQVSGRNDVSYQRRVELDVDYVRRQTLLLDLIILARTPRVILSSTGAR